MENFAAFFRKRSITSIAFIMLPLGATPAMASNSSVGSISIVLPHSAGLFFNQSGSRTSTPTCHTAGTRWVINTGTPQGQAMAAALLTAYSLGKRISVQGTGNCSLWGDTESVDYFVIED